MINNNLLWPEGKIRLGNLPLPLIHNIKLNNQEMGKLERNNTEEINWLYEYNVFQIQAKLKQSYSALC